jgi:predicted HAD superfamily Cof-like phosphohydrolase
MTTHHEDVLQFHNTFAVKSAWQDSGRIDPEVVALRKKLIEEEVLEELFPAMERFKLFPSPENLTEVADAMIDVVYFIIGGAVALELPWEELWNEVQRSNMAKVQADGTIHRREDGKILKPADWTPPDLFSIILEWGTDRAVRQNVELADSYAVTRVKKG